MTMVRCAKAIDCLHCIGCPCFDMHEKNDDCHMDCGEHAYCIPPIDDPDEAALAMNATGVIPFGWRHPERHETFPVKGAIYVSDRRRWQISLRPVSEGETAILGAVEYCRCVLIRDTERWPSATTQMKEQPRWTTAYGVATEAPVPQQTDPYAAHRERLVAEGIESGEEPRPTLTVMFDGMWEV